MLDLLLIQQSAGSWDKAVGGHLLPLSLITAARQIPRDSKVRLIDTRIDGEKTLEPHIKQKGLLIGFSLITGPSINNALGIIRRIRGINPTVKVIAGGVHPTILPEQTLAHPLIDYVAVGPGENILKDMVALRKKGAFDPSKIPGLGYKKNGQLYINPAQKIPPEELNTFELPEYRLVDMNNYLLDYYSKPTIYVESSRGCNFSCAFCSSVPLKNPWSAYSPEYVANNIEYLYSKYGIRSFLFVDLDFFHDPQRVKKICGLFIKRGLDISWCSQGVRVNEMAAMDDDYANLLKKSGFMEFEAIGTESGSQRIIDLMGKNYKIDTLIATNKRFASYKIPLRHSFVIGVPGETLEEVKQTISLALRLNKDNPYSANSTFYIYTPYPGTRFYQKALDAGFAAPQTLEAWSDLDGFITATPIYSSKVKETLERIHFLTMFTTLVYWKRYFGRVFLLKFVFVFYSKIALLRLKTGFFSCMPEFYLWKALRKRHA